jgi:hypothetical protein
MARDFESFIVDPSLLDPSIDATDLRTTTDTRKELLFNAPDYAGIQIDPTQQSYLADLYALYSGQLPLRPATPSAPPATPPSDGGDGGGAVPPTGGGESGGGTFIGGGATLEDAGGTAPGGGYATDYYGDVTGTPTSDGFLSSGAAGGANLPSTSPQDGFLSSGAAGGANLPSTSPQDGFLSSGAAGGASLGNTDPGGGFLSSGAAGGASLGNTDPGTVLGKPGIETFDDAETDIDLGGIPESTMPQGSPGQLNPYNPEQRVSIVEQAQKLGLGNMDQHIKNNNKLREAQKAGLISQKDYNILGGYDVTQNITGGSKKASATLNALVGPARNLYEAIIGEQSFGIIPGTTINNTTGALGLISQDQKNIHNAIINGDLKTPDGIAAVKNQIEMSQYKDPIMGMVNENILADKDINKMTDDIDFNDIETIDSSPITSDITSDQIDEFATPGTMPGNLGDTGGSMDDMSGTMPGNLGDTGGSMDDMSGTMPGNLGDTGGSMDDMSGTMPGNLGDTGGSMDDMSGVQKENQIGEAFKAGKQAIDSGVQTVSQVGQSIADSVKGTYNDLNKSIEVPGLGTINVMDTLAGLAINTAVGAPISIVKYALDQMPKSKSQIEYDGYTSAQQDIIDKAYSPGGVMEGYALNPTSQFGKGVAATIQERIDNMESRKKDGKPYSVDNLKEMKDLKKSLGLTTQDIKDSSDDKAPTAPPGLDEDIGVEGEDEGRFTDTPEPEDIDDISDGSISNPGGGIDISDIEGENDPDNEGDQPDDPGGDIDDASDGDLSNPGGGIDISDIEGENDPDNEGTDTGGGAAPGTGASGPAGGASTGGNYGGSGPAGGASTGGNYGGGGGGGGDGGGCFLAGTLVTMADGSTKPVEKVDLKDNVAEGGKVFATGKFLVENLHDYKGIKVSGSHMVNEDGNWVRVEDSKHGKLLGDDEHTVYVFGSENRKILINGILFTDYFEVKEQEKFLEDEKNFFKNWKQFSKEHNESNVNILNAS